MISPIIVNRLKILQGLSTLMFRRWSSPKGRGLRWLTVGKTDFLYRDMTFWVSLGSSILGNVFRSSSAQFLMVLFFWAVHGTVFCSKYFFLGLLLRSLSTQVFLVVLLCLVLSMTAFCYEYFFYGLCWGLLSPGCLSLVTFFFFFTTFIGLLRVRVFLFFPLSIFHSVLVQFCLFCFWCSFPRPSSTQLFYF